MALVKGYTRKSSKGKMVKVSSYSRNSKRPNYRGKGSYKGLRHKGIGTIKIRSPKNIKARKLLKEKSLSKREALSLANTGITNAIDRKKRTAYMYKPYYDYYTNRPTKKHFSNL